MKSVSAVLAGIIFLTPVLGVAKPSDDPTGVAFYTEKSKSEIIRINYPGLISKIIRGKQTGNLFESDCLVLSNSSNEISSEDATRFLSQIEVVAGLKTSDTEFRSDKTLGAVNLYGSFVYSIDSGAYLVDIKVTTKDSEKTFKQIADAIFGDKVTNLSLLFDRSCASVSRN